MKKYFLTFLVLISLLSCSVQKKLERNYVGEGREILMKEFGEPQKIVPLDDGKQAFIYVKETFVRETEIGTGRGTLDPRISPSFIKEEIYRFDINQQGIIVDAFYEKKIK